MAVRTAQSTELATVMGILEASQLVVDLEEIRSAIEADDVLVATDDGRILGVAVVVSSEPAAGGRIQAIAVRRGRRRQGIGTALLERAAADYGTLVAGFDAGVRPFWAANGFAIEPADEPGRFTGRLDGGRD